MSRYDDSKAAISVWNEGYETISSGSLVAIPPFGKEVNPHSDLLNITRTSTNQVGLVFHLLVKLNTKKSGGMYGGKNANYPTESKS